MKWLLRRLREPSSWRGLMWLATVAGLSLRPDQAEAIVTAGMALAGLLGVFLPDEPKNVRIELPPIDLIGQSQSYNDATKNVGEAPAAKFERSGANVANQNYGVLRAGAGVECGDPAADGMRGSVPSRLGPDADTQPNGWHQSGWGDK